MLLSSIHAGFHSFVCLIFNSLFLCIFEFDAIYDIVMVVFDRCRIS